MSAPWTRRRVLETFARWQREQPELSARLDAEGWAYADYHATRYAYLLNTVQGRSASPEPLAMLDVGPNIQTALLRLVHPEATVDTLGFAHPAIVPREGERHIEFDLNGCPQPELWPALERRYDLIVMAEVVEHLYVPPSAVLGFLRGRLRDPGFIVLQTPNAAALHKRLALLLGRNPVQTPRACRENPGHLHEYTLGELSAEVRACGLQIDWLRAENYFGSGAAARLYRAAGRVLPRTWRHGVTVCASPAP